MIIAGEVEIVYQSAIAEKERDKAQIESLKAKRINSFLQTMLASADPTKDGKDVKVVDILDKAVKKIDTELKDEPEIRAQLETTIGLTYQNLGIYDKAEVELAKALKIRKSLLGGNNDETAASIKNMALILHYEGKFKKAKEFYEEAIKIHKRFKRPKHIELAEALNDYGTLNLDLGEYDDAIKHFKESHKIYKEALGNKAYNTLAGLNNLGLSYHYKGDLKNAEKYYRAALSESVNLSTNERQEYITHVLNNLAYVMHDKGDFKSAIELYKKSLDLREKSLGENNPEVALAMCNLGGEMYYVKDFDGALGEINKAYEIWKKTLPGDHPYFSKVYFWQGRIFNERGMPGKAVSCLEKSLDILHKKEPNKNYLIAETRCEIRKSYYLLKRYNEAEPLIRKNFEVLRKELGLQ